MHFCAHYCITSFAQKYVNAKFSVNCNLISLELYDRSSLFVLSGAAAHAERFVSVSRLSVKAAVYVGSRQQNSSLHSETNQQFLTDDCTTALVLQTGISSSGIRLSHRLHIVTCTGNCTSSARQWPKIHARCQQEVTENYCTLGAFSLSAIKKY